MRRSLRDLPQPTSSFSDLVTVSLLPVCVYNYVFALPFSRGRAPRKCPSPPCSSVRASPLPQEVIEIDVMALDLGFVEDGTKRHGLSESVQDLVARNQEEGLRNQLEEL